MCSIAFGLRWQCVRIFSLIPSGFSTSTCLLRLLTCLGNFLVSPVTQTGDSTFLIVLLATAIGFNYGANLCLFPAFAKDLYGLKNFGMNYGILFTAWGVGGFFLSRVQQMLKASSGDFGSSFLLGAALLGLGSGLTLMIEKPKKGVLA